MFFRGQSSLSLDAKGRMVMPSRFREVLAENSETKLVISVDFEGQCLVMYPLSKWQEMEQKLLSLPSFNPATRRLQRMILGNAQEVEMDSNGRISVIAAMRDEVGLDKKIILVGLGTKLEIWSEDTWKSNYKAWKDEGPISVDDLPDSIKEMVL